MRNNIASGIERKAKIYKKKGDLFFWNCVSNDNMADDFWDNNGWLKYWNATEMLLYEDIKGMKKTLLYFIFFVY